MVLANGDQVVQNQWVHPWDSTGVHIIYADGTQTDFPDIYGGKQEKSSYTYQIDYVNEVHDKFLENRQHELTTNTVEHQRIVLEFIELLKQVA